MSTAQVYSRLEELNLAACRAGAQRFISRSGIQTVKEKKLSILPTLKEIRYSNGLRPITTKFNGIEMDNK